MPWDPPRVWDAIITLGLPTIAPLHHLPGQPVLTAGVSVTGENGWLNVGMAPQTQPTLLAHPNPTLFSEYGIRGDTLVPMPTGGVSLVSEKQSATAGETFKIHGAEVKVGVDSQVTIVDSVVPDSQTKVFRLPHPAHPTKEAITTIQGIPVYAVRGGSAAQFGGNLMVVKSAGEELVFGGTTVTVGIGELTIGTGKVVVPMNTEDAQMSADATATRKLSAEPTSELDPNINLNTASMSGRPTTMTKKGLAPQNKPKVAFLIIQLSLVSLL
jgi:hypothetical protein